MSIVTRYFFVSRIAARQQWAYRGELLMRLVSMVLFMSVFMALWHTVFSLNAGTLAGYTLVDMVWYLAMAETVTLSTSRAFMTISEAVKSGDLAYTLIRPISYPFSQVANSLGGSVPQLILNFVTASAVVALGVGWGAGSWPGLVAFWAMACLALVLDALIAVLIGLSAFWLEEVMPVFWIYQKLLFTVGGLFLPLELLPNWLQRVATRLPFRFVVNAPARAFVAFDPAEVGAMVMGQVIYILVLAVLVILVWRIARRRMVVHGG